MKHYGDITKIDGHEVPLVDIVTGGSPCQDLSVAGKREGLVGERSGLFMEQIRVIKEMRDESIRQLRLRGSTYDLRCIQPRYMVWENVPGAFSSNGGEDFRAVLEETAKVAEEDAVIPKPLGGKWTSSGFIVGTGWSIAWRVHDAQYWGVPQRRKRICLIADFGGQTAADILFELRRETEQGNSEQAIGYFGAECRPEVQPQSESLPGDFEQGEEEGQETAAGTGRSTDKAIYDVRISSDGTKNWRAHCYEATVCRNLDTGGGSRTVTTEGLQLSNPTDNQAYGVTTKGNGDAFISAERHTSLSTGGGEAGQGYPCVLEDKCLNSWDVQSKHIQPENGKAEALYSGECRYGGGESYVMQDAKVYGISAYESNAMKSPNPHSGIYEADTARTLDNNGGNPACNQGGMMVVQASGFKGGQSSGEIGYQDEVSPTLSANSSALEPTVLYDAYQHHGYRENETCGTLTAEQNQSIRGDTPIVLEGNGARESHQGNGYRESETMYTLNTVEQHAVCVSQDAYDKYAEGEKSASLKASGGMYGGAAKH